MNSNSIIAFVGGILTAVIAVGVFSMIGIGAKEGLIALAGLTFLVIHIAGLGSPIISYHAPYQEKWYHNLRKASALVAASNVFIFPLVYIALSWLIAKLPLTYYALMPHTELTDLLDVSYMPAFSLGLALLSFIFAAIVTILELHRAFSHKKATSFSTETIILYAFGIIGYYYIVIHNIYWSLVSIVGVPLGFLWQ